MITRRQLDDILEAGEIRTGSTTHVNQSRDHLPTQETDDAYAWLRANAKPVWHYITYDAPIPIDPVGTMRYIRQYGLDAAKAFFSTMMKADTRKIWDDNHPSLQDDLF